MGDDLRPGEIRRRLRIRLHRLDRLPFPLDRTASSQSLQTLLAINTIFDVSHHPGVGLGIQLPVEKMQQLAVVWTRIHDGIPGIGGTSASWRSAERAHYRIPVPGSGT